MVGRVVDIGVLIQKEAIFKNNKCLKNSCNVQIN